MNLEYSCKMKSVELNTMKVNWGSMHHKNCHLVVSEQGLASETQIASGTKLTLRTLDEIVNIFQFVWETEIEIRHDLRPEFHLRRALIFLILFPRRPKLLLCFFSLLNLSELKI